MKIAGSTGCKALSFFICLVLAAAVNGQPLTEITNFQRSDTQIKINCANRRGHLNCGIYSADKQGDAKLFDYSAAPASISLVEGIFVMLFPCGTQCSATYFYRKNKGLAGPFPLVEVYDLEFGVALGISKNPLPIYQIYPSRKNSVIGSIRLNLPRELVNVPGAISDVRLDNHKFIISYVDRHGDAVTFVYPVRRTDKAD
ncbi:hypothetical protein [Cupriavidus sp. M-11]|uniref:hypothetical protein n=1 Tax=Cupriavidus sp. M-11 TaxID=3233038 RepID=UPI003F935DD7